jgi:hypothetical protein
MPGWRATTTRICSIVGVRSYGRDGLYQPLDRFAHRGRHHDMFGRFRGLTADFLPIVWEHRFQLLQKLLPTSSNTEQIRNAQWPVTVWI